MHDMSWGGTGGWIMMISWWILIIAAIVLLVNWTVKKSDGDGARHAPLDTLKERYARGEISKEEFEEKKRDVT
jgi:putative membrane protein